MPPCAAAGEVRGQNLATAVLDAGTLSTTGFDPRNSSYTRRPNRARLGGGDFLQRGRAAETKQLSRTPISLQEVSQLHAFFFTVRRYNARVQRANDEALKCALYPYRSRCNEMLCGRKYGR